MELKSKMEEACGVEVFIPIRDAVSIICEFVAVLADENLAILFLVPTMLGGPAGPALPGTPAIP